MASIEITPISKQKPIYNNLVKYVLNKVDDSFINKLTLINEEINLIKKTVTLVEQENKIQSEKIKTLESGGIHEVFYLDLLDLIESNSLIPNHVYKLTDYSASIFLLATNSPFVGLFVKNPLMLQYFIYLTASSPNTFFKEARMEFSDETILTFDKEMVCHYSPYISNVLPYNDLKYVNPGETISNNETSIFGLVVPAATYRYKGIDYTAVRLILKKPLLFIKYIYIQGKYADRLELWEAILENPKAQIGYLKSNDLNLPQNWYNFMEKDNTENIVFSKDNIFDVLLKSYIYRGEITWMRDDLGNEAPYDFYSILHYYRTVGEIPTNYAPNGTIQRYIHKSIPLGFLNDTYQLFSNRSLFKNNKATSLFTTIHSSMRVGITENNILDECILIGDQLSCNNIVEKQTKPVFFSGSNNIIHSDSYIVAYNINNCDISFWCADILPNNMYECKLRGGAYRLYAEESVQYTEFNNPVYDIKNSNYTYHIYSRAIIDGYVLNKMPAQVDRNKLGIFYVTDIKNGIEMFTFKKGQTWDLWMTEVDSNIPGIGKPYIKDNFTFVSHEGTEKMHHNGNLLKRQNFMSSLLYEVYPHSYILEGDYFEQSE